MFAYFAVHQHLWGAAKANFVKHSVNRMGAHSSTMNTVLHNPWQPTNKMQAILIRDEVLPLLRHLIEK
jgi:hypothetical protein